MGFLDRVQGVFFNPKPTMADVAAKPKPIAWILILVLVLTAAFSYLSSPIASRETFQTMKDNVKLQERLGPERFGRMIADMEKAGTPAAGVRAALIGTALVGLFLLLQALILLVMGRLVSTEGAFLPVLAVLLHAGLIDKLLGGAVRAILILMRKSVIQTTTSLALLAPKADFTSNTYILLGQVDFFQLWMFAVVGFGLSAVFKIPAKKALVLSYSFWALKCLLNIALAFVGKSFLS
jgi:hypothetical protein